MFLCTLFIIQVSVVWGHSPFFFLYSKMSIIIPCIFFIFHTVGPNLLESPFKRASFSRATVNKDNQRVNHLITSTKVMPGADGNHSSKRAVPVFHEVARQMTPGPITATPNNDHPVIATPRSTQNDVVVNCLFPLI